MKEENIQNPEYGGTFALKYLYELLSDPSQHWKWIEEDHINGQPISDSEIENMKEVLEEAMYCALEAISAVSEKPTTCDKCVNTIPNRSGLLISPPNSKNIVKHYHLCPQCFDKIKKYITDLSQLVGKNQDNKNEILIDTAEDGNTSEEKLLEDYQKGRNIRKELAKKNIDVMEQFVSERKNDNLINDVLLKLHRAYSELQVFYNTKTQNEYINRLKNEMKMDGIG